jgi:hypothetical protein
VLLAGAASLTPPFDPAFIRFAGPADTSGTSGTSVNAAKLQPDVQQARIHGCRRQALRPSGPFSHFRNISVAWSALGSIRNPRH